MAHFATSSWRQWRTAVQHVMLHSSGKAPVSPGIVGRAFLAGHFKQVKGIRKVHHFIFDSQHLSLVTKKSTLDGPTTDLQLLKSSKQTIRADGITPAISLASLSKEHKK